MTRNRGGYESSSRRVSASELAAPPRGPAPGARIYHNELERLRAALADAAADLWETGHWMDPEGITDDGPALCAFVDAAGAYSAYRVRG
jgi:hypothetical protein